MSPNEIKWKLIEKRLRQADLARKWGVANCTVSALVHRKFRSARLERMLARELGVRIGELRGEERKAS